MKVFLDPRELLIIGDISAVLAAMEVVLITYRKAFIDLASA